MTSSFDSIARILPGYFSDEISEEERNLIQAWRDESPEHENEFRELQKMWDAYPLLHDMEQFDAFKALRKVYVRIHKKESRKWVLNLQRVAAFLAIPLLIWSGYLTIKKHPISSAVPAEVVWQTITTPPGVKSHFYLPDSTSIWLNSSSSASYPLTFAGDFRQVKITGEAFLDVKKDQKHPFVVELGKINIKVLGTRFDVIRYEKENQTDIILESGSISLSQGASGNEKTFAELRPGELASFDKAGNNLMIKAVRTDKYTSWIHGKLVFREDPMSEVVTKLNRWFNVQIEVADPEIYSYIYTATFQNESIDEILELLKISVPIRYQIIHPKKEGEIFKAKRIILRKRI
jgi:ferric-dicitrate binding protein FerR (iron transport regulator)